MAERPKKNQNWESRDIFGMGPKFRIDFNNPQMGGNGTNVYAMYGVTDSKDVCFTGLAESGTYRIWNDRAIEFIAGNKESSDGVDIVIAGMNGDVTITAMRNGKIRIRGKNVMIEADEDVDIKAGRNINLNSGSGRILLKGNKIDESALTGNAITPTFGMKVFEGSFVGADIISGAFSGIVPNISGTLSNLVGGIANFPSSVLSDIEEKIFSAEKKESN